MMRRLLTITFMCICCSLSAQQYDGMRGLIHTPTAEMDSVGVARFGGHFISREMMPDYKYFTWEDESGERHRYDSFSYYLSITPYRWIEATYTCVLLKYGPEIEDYKAKDRHFSMKVNPLREGKWWPSICFGGVDFMSSNLDPTSGQDFWRNLYVAASKHLDLGGGNELGVHAAYRWYLKEYNKRFQGVVGGLAYRPGFAPNVRAIVEWDGCHVNCGIDALLWRHLLVQASLQNGRYFSAGFCYKFYLL